MKLGSDAARANISETLDPPVATPRVSVVISNYNYQRFVGEAIACALAQTYDNLEVIIVDDGSTDDSSAVIKAFTSDPRLVAIFQRNAGQAAAINRGFEASTGDIVIFLDSDDLLEPGAAITIAANWEAGLSHLQFPLELIDADGSRIGLHPFSLHMEDGDIHWRMVVAGTYRFMPTSGNAFSRRALQRIMPIPEEEWRICADTYLVTIAPTAGAVKNLDLPLGRYRTHGLNNWYTQARTAEKMRSVWQLEIRSWRALIHYISATPPEPCSSAMARAVRDAAALYLHRRVVIGQHYMAEAFTSLEMLQAKWNLLRELAMASVPIRNKLLYVGFVLAMSANVWSSRTLRAWIIHSSSRPAWLRALLRLLKGKRFYEWMRMRRRDPRPPLELPIDKLLHFGRHGPARPFQWYGWARRDQYVDWCVGAEAALVAAAPLTTETLVFDAELIPFKGGSVTRQRLDVLANDHLVYRGAIDSKTKLRVQIPSRVWHGKTDLVLRFLTPDFAIPRLLKRLSEDSRPLSIAFEWMRWSILKDDSNRNQLPRPYLPVGPWISLADADSARYCAQGWRRFDDGTVRMVRRTAHLRATITDPAAGDHLLSIEFVPETLLERAVVSVGANNTRAVSLDLARQSRLDLLLPRGTIPKSGEIVILFAADAFIPAADRGHKADGPSGPGMTAFRLKRTETTTSSPIFQPGQILDFRAGGNGMPFLASGWHSPEPGGVKSADLVGVVEGLWFDRESEAFVTALVAPASSAGALGRQRLRLYGNGAKLAQYDIVGTSEICAIVPRGLVGAERSLRFEFHASALLRPSDLGDGAETRPVGFTILSLAVA